MTPHQCPYPRDSLLVKLCPGQLLSAPLLALLSLVSCHWLDTMCPTRGTCLRSSDQEHSPLKSWGQPHLLHWMSDDLMGRNDIDFELSKPIEAWQPGNARVPLPGVEVAQPGSDPHGVASWSCGPAHAHSLFGPSFPICTVQEWVPC